MLAEQIKTNRYRHLRENNLKIYPSDNPNADGFIFGDDMGPALTEIALGTVNPDGFNDNDAHIWEEGNGFSFRLSDNYWRGMKDGKTYVN